MPTDLLVPLEGWETVSESLDELRAGREESERFFVAWFDRMESLFADLLREEQRTCGESKKTEDEVDRWATILGEITQARGELAETRGEIQRMAEPIETVAQDAPARRAVERLQTEINAMRDERDAIRHEQLLLESDLENVRRNAARLAETLDEQKRTAAEQEQYWRGEFRRQCDLVERLTSQWMQTAPVGPGATGTSRTRPETAVNTVTPSPAGVAESGVSVGNAALESVQAQFELLQEEATRRRKKNAGLD
ncbi:MAG TPA: hypothetical protein VJL29_02120 [Thermoguttaceae bacterium]|nr:hypothetical protein [Thermoguttaceae bacterium]